MSDMDEDDEKFANNEYTKFVVKALKEAIDENERLRHKVDFLSQDNNILKNELDDKNKVIEELAEYYSYCKQAHDKSEQNHLNSEAFDTNKSINCKKKGSKTRQGNNSI